MVKQKPTRAKLVKTATYIANDATWVFAIVVAMSLVSSFASIRYLSGLDDDLGDLYEKDIRGQTYAQNAYVTLLGIESTAKDLVLAETEDERTASANALRSQGAALRSLVFKVAPTFDSGKYRTLISKSKADAIAFVEDLQRGLGPAGSHVPDGAEARKLLSDIEPKGVALRNDLVKINDIKRRSNLTWFRAVRVQLRISLYATITILAVSLGVRIFLWRGKKRADAKAASETDDVHGCPRS
jgi:hypothetical protein